MTSVLVETSSARSTDDARTTRSRSLSAVTVGMALANSNPTLPVGPHCAPVARIAVRTLTRGAHGRNVADDRRIDGEIRGPHGRHDVMRCDEPGVTLGLNSLDVG
jgi:hypothetical protein